MTLEETSSTDSPRSIRRIGHYDLIELLGKGGMGDVYKAWEINLSRFVAIKVIREKHAEDEQFVARFRREAAAAANVHDPNIVAIHFFGQEADTHFLVMELVIGESLSSWLRRNPKPTEDEILELTAQCFQGLAAAHEHGLVHRDIKPANLLVEKRSGRLKIADFGLARSADDTNLTTQGAIVGTPRWMAPEVCKGLNADHRSDLYAVGVIMFEMFAGHPPFEADTISSLLFQHVHEPPPLELIRFTASPPVQQLIAKLLAKSPSDRYQSAADALNDIRQVQHGKPLHVKKTARRTSLGLTTVLVIIAVVSVGVSLPLFLASMWVRPVIESEKRLEGFKSTSMAWATQRRFTNSIGMQFTKIQSGDFIMGADDPKLEVIAVHDLPMEYIEAEYPNHGVQLSNAYFIGVYEVTEHQFERVMGYSTRGGEQTSSLKKVTPVRNVSWDQSVTFCETLSALSEERSLNRRYRLPTEAEWEFACRADAPLINGAPFPRDSVKQHAWIGTTSSNRLQPIGKLQANSWGLYDMIGNVSEWCNDRFARDYYGQSPKRDPMGPTTGLHRVHRGGSYHSPFHECRVSFRSHADSGQRSETIGFRVVCQLDTEKATP